MRNLCSYQEHDLEIFEYRNASSVQIPKGRILNRYVVTFPV